MKSISVNVAWPAYLLGKNPSERIISASYSQGLSYKHSVDTRLVLESPWYQEIFPDVNIVEDQNTKSKFVTTERGHRIATSVGGTLTGEGGNILILDDPHSAQKADSKVDRETVISWYEQVFATRLDNKQEGVIVIVMQRLHAEDLCGYLLSKSDNWEHLKIPAETQRIKTFSFPTQNRRHIMKRTDTLHPERENKETLEKLKGEIGSYAYAGQYLQEPAPIEGGMIKEAWFKNRYTELPEEFDSIIQSWDTAIKKDQLNDYSVCTTWGRVDNVHYLISCKKQKLEYPDLKRELIRQAELHNPNTILIEDKASGQQLLQDLRRDSDLPIVAISPKLDKIARLALASPTIEAGRVVLPGFAYWLDDFMNEITCFPNAVHDDIVDSVSQYLNWVKESSVVLNISAV